MSYNNNYGEAYANDTYEIKTGGGCLILFGLPFFLVGLTIMLSPFFPDSDAPLPVSLFGLVFAAVGAGFIFGRAGLVIDKNAGTITKWWGMLGFKKKTVFEVAGAKTVWIAKETRTSHSKNGTTTYTVYPIRVELEDETIDVEEPRQYEKARKRLEGIAKFLDLGTKDTTGIKTIIRNAGTLDMSIKERLNAEGIKPVYPEPPEDLRIEVKTQGHEAELTIPPTGFGCQTILGIFFGLIFGGMPVFVGLGVFFTSPEELEGIPLPIQIIIGIVLVIWCSLGLGIMGYSILMSKRMDVVSVSPDSFTLMRKNLLGYKPQTISAHKIEEVELIHPEHNQKGLVKNALVCVRSDDLTLSFGYALTKAELKWMRDLITYILAS